MEKEKLWRLVTEFAIGGGIKSLFFLFSLIEYCCYQKMGHSTHGSVSWTNSFFVKMSFNFILSINYSAFALTLGNWYYLFSYNAFIWLISCGLLYFEYIRKLKQSWLSLRLFWFINGLFYIGKICYTFLRFKQTKEAIVLKLLYCYLIQAIPSFFLMAFSLFKPSDNESRSQVIFIEDQNKMFNSSFISNISQKIKEKFLVTVTISEHKSFKCKMKDEEILPVNISEMNRNITKREHIKLKFIVVFYPNIQYVIKKSLTRIIEFNTVLIEKIETTNLEKKKCFFIIQLKNLNIFFKKKQDYSNKLNELQNVYSNLCQKNRFALMEFLNFCDMLDENLKRTLLNLFDELKANEFKGQDNNVIIQDNEEIDQSDMKNKNSLNLDKRNNNQDRTTIRNSILEMESSDIIKTAKYISLIINKEQPFTLKILNLNEKPKIQDSEIVCTINSEIKINVLWESLITLMNDDEKINTTPMILQLKQKIKDGNILSSLKKEGNEIRSLLETIFNEIINNLMYYDAYVFLIFELNKIIKLDIEEIDMDIMSSFFELEYFSVMHNPLQSIYYSNPKCNIESIKYYTSCAGCNNDIALKIKLSIHTQHDKKWENIICLNELDKQCKEIINLNKCFSRFIFLNPILESIVKTMCGLIKGYDVIEDKDDEQVNNDIAESLIRDCKEISIVSIKNSNEKQWSKHIKELTELINQLLIPKHYYIFYTPYFRKAFRIDEFFGDFNDNDQYFEYNQNSKHLDNSFYNNDSFIEDLKC